MGSVTLTDLCRACSNYFIEPDGVHTGAFTITGGALELDGLMDGQYFNIAGSRFNDGVHSYPTSDLTDETFTGGVWYMRVPPDFLTLLDNINSWLEKYSGDNALDSPYQSESFGGYSYSKGGSAAGVSGADAGSWQAQFKTRLNRWRKARTI